ncbi:MAG: hypothetical protein QOG19_1654 [Mycobacterium sp.]|nr:hypothetical protein [Mycobacterium sp.]
MELRREQETISTSGDLDTAIAGHDHVTLVDERSMVTLARRASTGSLAAIIGAIDTIPAGHRAMVLRNYSHQPSQTRTVRGIARRTRR